MNFSGKTILLTGATSGIGYELAGLIAEEKCNLALLSRRKEITDAFTLDEKFPGSNILSIKCDVTKKADVISAIEEINSKFGKIDIAILNSGASQRVPVEQYNSKSAEEIFGVNVMGIVYFLEALIPQFINSGDGMIVGVSSLADGRGFPKSGFYSGSKAAATLLLESVRVELKKYNIKVLTVKPGFIKTPMTDKNEFRMPFLMSVNKGAEIIFNGIKKEKRLIQFPLPMVLGAKLLRIIPDRLFDLLASRI